MEKKNKNDRPEAYPKPTVTDNQLHNQAEFIDEQPNDFEDKSISDFPRSNAKRQSNDPEEETSRGE
jgi:hypothetical protein